MDYVLTDFDLSEVSLLQETVDKCTDALLQHLQEIPLIESTSQTELSDKRISFLNVWLFY